MQQIVQASGGVHAKAQFILPKMSEMGKTGPDESDGAREQPVLLTSPNKCDAVRRLRLGKTWALEHANGREPLFSMDVFVANYWNNLFSRQMPNAVLQKPTHWNPDLAPSPPPFSAVRVRGSAVIIGRSPLLILDIGDSYSGG